MKAKQNNDYRTLKIAYCLILAIFLFCSCKKQNEWLDSKRQKADVVPKTLHDFQAILDNVDVMNFTYSIASAGIDNFYFSFNSWQSKDAVVRNPYIWASDINQASVLDWSSFYKIVMQSNVVLEGLDKIQISNSNTIEYRNIKGQALFFRAKAFFDLASIYAKPYSTTASTDLGIPLRTASDVNVKFNRATVQQTYEKIILDLKEAELLLPVLSSNQTRPSKTATEALLARLYLSMEDYVNAGKYANIALTNKSDLIDFNTLTGFPWPMPDYPNNSEIIFWSRSASAIGPFSGATVDANLFASYDVNDLRQKFYFNLGGNIVFVGSYLGSLGYLFSGIATNEIYLIRAECNARNGNVSAALTDLNILLLNRWVSGTYINITTTNSDEALQKILDERRKELPFTESLRWDDLRRLNKDPRFAITLTRNLNGQIYSLPPNDKRYVWPIPLDEIKLSGIPQNQR